MQKPSMLEGLVAHENCILEANFEPSTSCFCMHLSGTRFWPCSPRWRSPASLGIKWHRMAPILLGWQVKILIVHGINRKLGEHPQNENNPVPSFFQKMETWIHHMTDTPQEWWHKSFFSLVVGLLPGCETHQRWTLNRPGPTFTSRLQASCSNKPELQHQCGHK